MAAKQANSQANITYTQAVGLAQIARRQAEANAQASYQVNYSIVTQSQSVAQAQQTLASDQAQTASYFRTVTANPPFLTMSQQFTKAVQEGSWAGAFNFAMDFVFNGGWSELVTSPQFTAALNATDAFFAGWADGLTLGLSTKLRTEMYGDLATRNHQGAYFNAGNLVGSIQLQLIFANPCSLGAAGQLLSKVYNGYQAYQGLNGAYENFQQGNYLMAGLDLLGVAGSVSSMLKACFTGDMQVLTPDGDRLIEQIRPGDLVLSRHENDPDGPVEAKVVEEVFVRTARIMELRIRGRLIRTTAEHPFWIKGKGWLAAAELQIGDLLSSHDGQWAAVEELEDTE